METSPAYTSDQICQWISNILTVIDNNERRATEVQLTTALQNPANLRPLATILCGTGDGQPSVASTGVRQMAAVLLRKRIFTLWRVLSVEEKHQLRHLLLHQLGVEPTRVVRFALAHIVTRLAKAAADEDDDDDDGESNSAGSWPELYQAIYAASEDSRVDMRELAMVLLYSFGEVFADANDFSGMAAESVVRGMKDGETVVQTAAVKAAMVLLPSLQDQPSVRNAFLSHLIPACVEVMDAGAAVEAKVPLCVSVLDLFEQLLEALSVKKSAALLAQLAQTLIRVLGASTSHPRVRENCGAALGQLSTMKPKFVVSQGLLQPMVEVSMHLLAENDALSFTIGDEDEVGPDGNDDDANDDDDDDLDLLRVLPPFAIGVRLLSTVATSVSSKAFTEMLLPFISGVLDNPSSAVPTVRRAAITALSSLGRGNASYLRRRVGYVIGVTQRFLKDEDPTTREAAAYALYHFCLDLQPELLLHHAELMPLLVTLLQDPSDLVRRRIAVALDSLCESMEKTMDPYVPLLLPAVMAAISGSSLETQRRLCGVISSMGETRCAAFVASAPALLEALQQPFTLRTPETLALRAQVTETVGIIGSAMGREAFAPFLPFFMNEVVANLQTKNVAVREQSFGFLCNVCELLREDFLVYVDDVLRFATETIEEDRAVYTNKHLLADGGTGGQGMAFGNDSDDSAEKECHMRVRTADVEEKASAVFCVGVMAQVLMSHLGAARVAQCWELLFALDTHYYPNIRCNALVALARVVKASYGLPTVQQVLPSKRGTVGVLPPEVQSYLHSLVSLLLDNVVRETEKEVVGAACEAMGELLSYFGMHCLAAEDNLDTAMRAIVQFLRCTMPCQIEEGDGGFDDSDPDNDVANSQEDVFFGPYDEACDAEAAQPQTASPQRPAWHQFLRPDTVTQGVHLPEDHEDVVLEAASSLLEAVAEAYGLYLQPYMPFIFPLLLLHADVESRPAEGLVMAMGTMASLLQSFGATCPLNAMSGTSSEQLLHPYAAAAVRASLSVITSSDESAAKANSAYVLRVLLERCTVYFTDTAVMQETLQSLWCIVGNKEEEIPEALDNAVSATCSLTRCLPAAQVPFDHVVPALLVHLPMKVDAAENANGIQTLNYFLGASMDGITPQAAWLPGVAAAAAQVLLSPQVKEEEKRDLVQSGIAVFQQRHADLWQQAVQTLPGELQSTLQSAVV